MSKLKSLFFPKTYQPIPLSRNDFARGLGFVFGIQAVVSLAVVCVYLWAASRARFDVQLGSFAFLTVFALFFHFATYQRIDMGNRLAYLFPECRGVISRFLNGYYVFPIIFLLPFLIYLLQDRKPSRATQLPFLFRRPLLIGGMYFSSFILLPFTAGLLELNHVPSQAVRHVAYFANGPTSTYMTDLITETLAAKALGRKIKAHDGDAQLVEREIRSEGKKFVRTATGTLLLAAVAVHASVSKDSREIAAQGSSPKTLTLFRNLKSVIEIESLRPSLAWQINPIHFLNPATAVEACLIGIINTWTEAVFKLRFMGMMDRKVAQLEASSNASAETKQAVQNVMTEIRSTPFYKDVLIYRKLWFEEILNGKD